MHLSRNSNSRRKKSDNSGLSYFNQRHALLWFLLKRKRMTKAIFSPATRQNFNLFNMKQLKANSLNRVQLIKELLFIDCASVSYCFGNELQWKSPIPSTALSTEVSLISISIGTTNLETVQDIIYLDRLDQKINKK